MTVIVSWYFGVVKRLGSDMTLIVLNNSLVDRKLLGDANETIRITWFTRVHIWRVERVR
jgi:hypothetical protein